MEQVVTTLLEDACEMSEEAFENLLDVMLLAAVDQVENELTCSECVGPFFHLKCAFELILSHIQQFRCALVVL